MSATTAEHAEPEILSANEAARLLRVSPDLVRKLATNGRLPAARVGGLWRFRRADVERLLEPIARTA